MEEKLKNYAQKLAEANAENEPAITEIYLFPSDTEIRLIELDPTAPSSEEIISPYYFPPDPRAGIPLPSGIALIPPDQKGKLRPPADWGPWAAAILIYKREEAA